MKAKPVQVVYGPGTFLNRAVAAVNRRSAALVAASSAVKQAGRPRTGWRSARG